MGSWFEMLSWVERSRGVVPNDLIRKAIVERSSLEPQGWSLPKEFEVVSAQTQALVLVELAQVASKPTNLPELARALLASTQARKFWMEAVIALLECGDESGVRQISLALGDSAHPLPRYEWQDSSNEWARREGTVARRWAEPLYKLLDF